MRIKDWFTVPEGKSVTEKVFGRVLLSSVCSILLCMVCLASTTWAWFSVSLENTGNEIQIAAATVEVKVNDTTLDANGGSCTVNAGTHTVAVKLTSYDGAKPVYVVLAVKSQSGEGTENTELNYYWIQAEPVETKVTLNTEKAADISYGLSWVEPNAAQEITAVSDEDPDSGSDSNSDSDDESGSTSESASGSESGSFSGSSTESTSGGISGSSSASGSESGSESSSDGSSNSASDNEPSNGSDGIADSSSNSSSESVSESGSGSISESSSESSSGSESEDGVGESTGESADGTESTDSGTQEHSESQTVTESSGEASSETASVTPPQAETGENG